MKLSKNAISILNNFANISDRIRIKQGKEIRIVSDNGSGDVNGNGKNVVAIAELDIEFPQDFDIIGLKNFLNTLNAFKDPDLEFYENYVSIKEGDNEYCYYRSNGNLIRDPHYGKNFAMAESLYEFDLSKEQLIRLGKAANLLKSLSTTGSSLIRFYKNDNNEIIIEVKLSYEDPIKNNYRIIIGKENNDNIKFDFYIESKYITLIEDDYRIVLYPSKCMKFQGLNIPISYIIGYKIIY